MIKSSTWAPSWQSASTARHANGPPWISNSSDELNITLDDWSPANILLQPCGRPQMRNAHLSSYLSTEQWAITVIYLKSLHFGVLYFIVVDGQNANQCWYLQGPLKLCRTLVDRQSVTQQFSLSPQTHPSPCPVLVLPLPALSKPFVEGASIYSIPSPDHFT